MGFEILSRHLGLVDAERFIALIQREKFDYTRWRQDLFAGLSGEEISREAMAATMSASIRCHSSGKDTRIWEKTGDASIIAVAHDSDLLHTIQARSIVIEILSLNRLPREIRDECRGNKTVSRSALIEIARKKQPCGMTTAWEKYKGKSRDSLF